MLAAAPHAPERLYGLGNPEALSPGVAVIGARKATPYGLTCTERFAAHIARRGMPVVAGGARGCDLAAHRTALACGGTTVVVLGGGADWAYPQQGKSTFQQVIDSGGAVVAEWPWGTHPLPAYFRERNRIIAGLSVLLVIAEAGLPSGTFSTADAALEQGKEVAVVPGTITSPNSRGSNMLIAQGAPPLLDEEILDCCIEEAFMQHPFASTISPVPTGPARIDALLAKDALLRALSAEAYRPDELTAYFGFSAAELSRRLAGYELAGLVERGVDGRYQLKAHVRE